MIAIVLLIPPVVGTAMVVLYPPVRQMPAPAWVMAYAVGVAGGLCGWFVRSRLSAWSYRRAFRNRDRQALDRIAKRAARRLRGRGELYEAQVDILEATAHESAERFADALRLYDSAVGRIEKGQLAKLRSSLPILKNDIAWCLVELGADPQRALALATESAAWAAQQRKREVQASCLSTLGAAQLQNGDHRTAMETLRESLALTDDRAGRSSISYHLGEALHGAGRLEEARSSYQNSRDGDPGGRHGKLAAARLATL